MPLRTTGYQHSRVDLTVASPWNVQLPAAATPDEAAVRARQRKLTHYHSTSPDYTVVPLAVTAAGVWDDHALRWLKGPSASQLALRLGGTHSDHAVSVMTSLSVAFWRGIALKVQVVWWRGNRTGVVV